jgi:ubiquinone/menaquinone biosynthesis C-methylase UbiE
MNNEKVKGFFDSQVSEYETKHYGAKVRSLMTERLISVLETVDNLLLPRGSKILDAGCGPGFLLEAFAKSGFQVSGIDMSDKMLRRSAERLKIICPEFPVNLDIGNVEELPYEDNYFDLVCSTGVIEYLAHDHVVLKEIFRVLRPGGYLVLPVTNYWSPINCFDFVIEFITKRKRLLSVFNLVWQRLGQDSVLARDFHIRRHKPSELRKSLIESGFIFVDGFYFHFMPWPRPFDQLFPRATSFLGQKLERFRGTCIGPLGEGYLTLSRKPIT